MMSQFIQHTENIMIIQFNKHFLVRLYQFYTDTDMPYFTFSMMSFLKGQYWVSSEATFAGSINIKQSNMSIMAEKCPGIDLNDTSCTFNIIKCNITLVFSITHKGFWKICLEL